jgi:hypothetical protein
MFLLIVVPLSSGGIVVDNTGYNGVDVDAVVAVRSVVGGRL